MKKIYYPTFQINPLLGRFCKQEFDGSGILYTPEKFKELKEKQFQSSSLVLALFFIVGVVLLSSLKWYNLYILGLIISIFLLHQSSDYLSRQS